MNKLGFKKYKNINKTQVVNVYKICYTDE